MKIDELKIIREKSNSKNDGVYSYKGYFYLVFKNELAAYSDYFGNIYELSYGFHATKGKADDRFKAKDILKGYLKQLKKSN